MRAWASFGHSSSGSWLFFSPFPATTNHIPWNNPRDCSCTSLGTDYCCGLLSTACGVVVILITSDTRKRHCTMLSVCPIGPIVCVHLYDMRLKSSLCMYVYNASTADTFVPQMFGLEPPHRHTAYVFIGDGSTHINKNTHAHTNAPGVDAAGGMFGSGAPFSVNLESGPYVCSPPPLPPRGIPVDECKLFSTN